METLQERRLQARLCMAFKILNEHVILEAGMLPKYKIKPTQRQCNSTNVGFENQLIEPQPQFHASGETFFYSIQKTWNERVTPSQARAPSVDAFRQHFKRNCI